MPRKVKTYTTTVLGNIEMNNQPHLILKDHTGYETYMPIALVRDNCLIIDDNHVLNITEGLYEMWFIKSKEAKRKDNSSILFRNFKKLYENRNLILNNKGYYKICTSWLYSGALFFGSRSYSIGSLLVEWEHNALMKTANGFIYRISGSMLSGMNKYQALDINDGSITEGSIYETETIHWKKYLLNFEELSKQRKNSLQEDIHYTNKLIAELNLT